MISRCLCPRLVAVLLLFLWLPPAWSAPPAPEQAHQPLVTFYFGAFHFQEYYQMPPITPDNIRRRYPPIPIRDPAVMQRLSGWLATRGGATPFSPQATRVRADFADGRPPVFVDDFGVVRAGKSEYALPRAEFEHVSVTLQRIRTAYFDAEEAARQRARPALVRAVERDDAAEVGRLLAHGADVNVRDNYHPGATPLIRAARSGSDTLCRLLLDWGADINAQDRRGFTAISYASHYYNRTTARLLLTRGESARNWGGDYALTEAVYQGASFGEDAPLIGLLLDRGAAINTRDDLKKTPLMIAVDQRLGGVARLLIERGAAVNVVDVNGWTPLHSAADTGDEQLAALLMDRGAEVNADPHRNGNIPLLLAVAGGHTAVVKLLLVRGASYSLDGDEGSQILKVAADAGNTAIIQMLLQAGAKK